MAVNFEKAARVPVQTLIFSVAISTQKLHN